MSNRVYYLSERRRLKRLLEKLPLGGTPDLVVLKGHLLLEEVLLDILKSAFRRHPQGIRDARLRFPQIASLVRGLVDDPKLDWLWLALDKINQLRNDLAHRLEPQQFERLAAELVDLVAPRVEGWSETPGNSPMEKLPGIVAALHGTLSGIDDRRARRRTR